MPEPASIWGVFKSFFGIFGSIAKEVIKRYNQPKLVIKAVRTGKSRNGYLETVKPFQMPSSTLNMYAIEENMLKLAQQHEQNLERQRQYEEALTVERPYTLEWKYDIGITNNSEHTAYKLKLIKSSIITKIDEVDYTKPIPPNQSVTYSITLEESILATKPDVDRRLLEGGAFELRVEYSNVKGTGYFTVFNNGVDVEEQNHFGRIK
jgi:hypothetical protein